MLVTNELIILSVEILFVIIILSVENVWSFNYSRRDLV